MRLTKIKHSSHSQHWLIWKHPQEPYRCDGCKELGFGPCYQCEYEECNFHLDEHCANADSSISHPFLIGCSLKFHNKKPQERDRYCDACGKDVLGFLYQCAHKHPHDLHPCCAKLQNTLTADGITLYLSKKLTSKCLHCGRKEILEDINTWGYVSSCGRYCYHIACVKDIILTNWKRGYFREQGDANEMRSLVSTSQEIIKARRGSSSKAAKLWKTAKTVITLIISAIFGDPTSLILALAQQLFQN